MILNVWMFLPFSSEKIKAFTSPSLKGHHSVHITSKCLSIYIFTSTTLKTWEPSSSLYWYKQSLPIHSMSFYGSNIQKWDDSCLSVYSDIHKIKVVEILQKLELQRAKCNKNSRNIIIISQKPFHLTS